MSIFTLSLSLDDISYFLSSSQTSFLSTDNLVSSLIKHFLPQHLPASVPICSASPPAIRKGFHLLYLLQFNPNIPFVHWTPSLLIYSRTLLQQWSLLFRIITFSFPFGSCPWARNQAYVLIKNKNLSLDHVFLPTTAPFFYLHLLFFHSLWAQSRQALITTHHQNSYQVCHWPPGGQAHCCFQF